MMERLSELASFLTEFERPDLLPGEWHGGETVTTAEYMEIRERYVVYHPIVESLIESAYKNSWVLTDFNWSEWMQSSEFARFQDDETALDHARANDLCRLLTVYIRGDRFSEGALMGAFESGLMLRIVRRAKVLADSSSSSGAG
jgi:Family of unknown function (DUF6508)